MALRDVPAGSRLFLASEASALVIEARRTSWVRAARVSCAQKEHALCQEPHPESQQLERAHRPSVPAELEEILCTRYVSEQRVIEWVPLRH